MDRPSPAAIAAMLLSAPGWARFGLTVRDETLRVRAAECLRRTVADGLEPAPETDARQMSLSL